MKKDNKKKKFNYLKDIDVREVTLCKSPVQGDSSKFNIIKAADELQLQEGQEELDFFVPITKASKSKRLVYGYVLVPNEDQFEKNGDVDDNHGDIITKEEVEKAAHSFLRNMSARNQKGSGTGLQHIFFDDIGFPVESYVDVDGKHGRSGGWVVGTKITDDGVWDAIDKGEITGYSMGGTGYRKSIDSEGIESPQDNPMSSGSFDKGVDDSDALTINKKKGVKAMEITAEVRKSIGDIVSEQLEGLLEDHLTKPMARIRKSIEDIRDESGLGEDRSSLDVDERIRDIEKAMVDLAEDMGEKFEALIDSVEKALDHLDEALGDEDAGSSEGEESDDGVQKADGDAGEAEGEAEGSSEEDSEEDSEESGDVVKAIESAFGAIGKKIDDLAGRVSTVEKARGVKRSIEGTPEDDVPDDVDKGDDTWASGSPFAVGSASRQ